MTGLAGLSAWSLRPELVPACASLSPDPRRPSSHVHSHTVLPVAHAEVAPKEGIYIDPTTSTPFSSKIVNPNGKVLQLVGSGVRTVSFLAVRVYCAGMYIAEDAVQRIEKGKLPGWEVRCDCTRRPPGDKLTPSLFHAGVHRVASHSSILV